MNVHVGNKIRERVEEIGMKKSEFARRINCSPQNVYDIFERKTLDSKLLSLICKVLDYDFFQYFSNNGKKLVINEEKGEYISIKDYHKLKEEYAQIKKLTERYENEMEMLKQENKYLKEINDILKKKK